MKRTCLALLCTALVHVLAPNHADAWWETIERLSGPGRFYGWSVEARLVCFVVDPSRSADTVARIPPPIGSVTASCRVEDGEVRRGAIDLNTRFVWAHDPRFAGGQRINLTTFAPSISWNVIPNRNWDFVDVGFAAGAFWFTSRAFPSFNGAFLEPVRFDFHTTTQFKREHPKVAVAIPRVRVGWLLFPAGFEPDVFAPAVPERISRDWPMNIAIFADLESVFNLMR